MKRIAILVILIVLVDSLFSQNIKTCTESRSLSIANMTVDGTETYTYIEKNSERIKTGSYTFAKDINKRNYNNYTGRYEEEIIHISV